MDPSALIFVALAVAWAVYLVPKALEQHEEGTRSRTVDRFSHTMRVLARREPVSRRKARLVTTRTAGAAGRSSAPETVGEPAATQAPPPARAEQGAPEVSARPASSRARRQAAAIAARRRRRVVALILVATLAVAGAAASGSLAWAFVAVPVGVLVAWLVCCRLMVRKERAIAPSTRLPAVAEPPAEEDDQARTDEISAVVEPPVDPDSWDPVPATLPTYVTKPVATRSVRTIDLDSTGVWSSGHSESDSQLVREADEAAHAARTRESGHGGTQRAVGS